MSFRSALPHNDVRSREGRPLGTFWTNAAFWSLPLLVLFFMIVNIFWLKRNLLVIPPPWDQAFYLYMSVRYLHALSDGGPLALFREFVHLSPQIAPLFPLTTVPLYLLFGMSRLVAHMTNAVYLFLLCLGVYLIGKRLYGRQMGFLAVLFVSTFTAVVNFSRDYLLEFPSAAFVTLGIYALLRSEDLRHRSWCIGFGALVGLALLTKTMAGAFFVALLFAILALSKGIKGILHCRGKAAGEVQEGRQEGYLWIWLVVGYGILTIVPTKGGERFAQPLLAAIALLLAGSMQALSL